MYCKNNENSKMELLKERKKESYILMLQEEYSAQ